jgi:hypothetical protein
MSPPVEDRQGLPRANGDAWKVPARPWHVVTTLDDFGRPKTVCIDHKVEGRLTLVAIVGIEGCADDVDEATAAWIVRAANAFDALVAQAEDALGIAEQLCSLRRTPRAERWRDGLRAALALARAP